MGNLNFLSSQKCVNVGFVSGISNISERPVLTLKGTRKVGCREQKLYSAMYKKHIRPHQNLFPRHYRPSLFLCLFHLSSPSHLAVSRPHARLARPTAALYPSFLLPSPDFTSDIDIIPLKLASCTPAERFLTFYSILAAEFFWAHL